VKSKNYSSNWSKKGGYQLWEILLDKKYLNFKRDFINKIG